MSNPSRTSVDVRKLTSEVELRIAENLVKRSFSSLNTDCFSKAFITAADYHWQKLANHRASWLYSAVNPEFEFLTRVQSAEFYSNFFKGTFGKLEPIIMPPYNDLFSDSIDTACSFIKQVLEFKCTRDYDHLTASVECTDSVTPIALERNGFFLADTIVIYSLEIAKANLSLPAASAPIRVATQRDLQQLQDIAAECFGDRANSVNQLSNDPMFAPSQVKEFYSTWATRCLDGSLADRVIVFDDGKLAGFLAVQLPPLTERAGGIHIAKIPLNAVHPHSQGKGIYRQLLNYTLHWLAAEGVEWVQIGTQLSSKIHSPWRKFGANISRTYHQFRYHK